MDYNNAARRIFEPLHHKFFEKGFTFLDLMLLTSGPIKYYYTEPLFTEIIEAIENYGVDFLNREFCENPERGSQISKTIMQRLKRLLDEPKEDEHLNEEFNLSERDIQMFNLNLKAVIMHFSDLCPEFIHGVEFTSNDKKELEQMKKQELRAKAPSNGQRLKALTVFCPELIDKLLNSNKEIQSEIGYLITGVNKTDAYKFLFTADRRTLEGVDSKDINKAKEVFDAL